MNPAEGNPSQGALADSGLEVRSRQLLDAGLSHVDSRTRSRLNQARQAAVAAAARPAYLGWFSGALTRQTLMPATGAAVAVLVAVFMFGVGGRQLATSVTDNPANALDVLDLVTDDDAMNLMEDDDSSFYEWAAAENDAPGPNAGQSQSGSQGAGGVTT
jgi:hypothetical protein